MTVRTLICALATSAALLAGTSSVAAEIPKEAQQAFARLGLGGAVVGHLTSELAVPQAWIEGARREGEVIILGTWHTRRFNAMTAPFAERYPFIRLRYARTSNARRGMQVLVALREGRAIADVITAVRDTVPYLKKEDALADLRNLPSFASQTQGFAAPDGLWAGFALSYRCMAYNTHRVSARELPRTWDDLVSDPRWGHGRLGLANRPASWLLNLWQGKGEAWGRVFTRHLFDNLAPQRRKEELSALIALTAAGEFDATIPAPFRRVKQYREKGAPVAIHCPSPVPLHASQIFLLKQARHKNAGRIFINWLLSLEGQVMEHVAAGRVPIHRSLQTARFLAFPKAIMGKPVEILDTDRSGDHTQKEMERLWNDYWIKRQAADN